MTEDIESKMKGVIRPAEQNDRRSISSLYARMHRPSRRKLDLTEYFVAVADKKVIGCIGIHDFGEGSYLFGLTVHPTHQRNGIGSALIHTCLNRARKRRSKFAVALVMFWNLRFLRRFGFRLISRKELPKSVFALHDFNNSTYRYSCVMAKRLAN